MFKDRHPPNGHSNHQFPTSISKKSFAHQLSAIDSYLKAHFYTFYTAFPRLPIALVPFAFSQFILVEALAHQGWIDTFAQWLNRASGGSIYPTIWIIGIMGVILCNISGTNIGATILLTKVARASTLPDHSLVAAAVALAVASNIGAVSFTFSASLAGLLWKGILDQKDISMKQRSFAFWNILPITVMTAVGLGVVCIEMAVLY
jgi:Na+/H+ antiporter NhaD/arsenite permease-like protein